MTLAYVGLGSNSGDRRAHLDAAVTALGPVRVSSYLETPALLAEGDTKAQPPYLNAVAVVETVLPARAFLEVLRTIERQEGREAVRARWQPRTLDLDLLLYGELVIEEPDLKVPHPELHRRRFVLEPLVEIAPDVVHPVLRVSVRELLARI